MLVLNSERSMLRSACKNYARETATLQEIKIGLGKVRMNGIWRFWSDIEKGWGDKRGVQRK